MTSDGLVSTLNSYTTCYCLRLLRSRRVINISLSINVSFLPRKEAKAKKTKTVEGWYKENECLYQLSGSETTNYSGNFFLFVNDTDGNNFEVSFLSTLL